MSSEERNENLKSNTKTVAQSFEVEIKRCSDALKKQ